MKVRVLKPFRDIKTKELYSSEEGNNIIEMSVRRFNEAVKNLEKEGGGFLEKVEE